MDQARLSAEQQIREALARRAFDDLPGAGKPLDLSDADDPEWFAKRLLKREGVDTSHLVHPTTRLRREAETFPEALVPLRSEARVRAVLEDFNERVRAEWRRPVTGPTFPWVARLVDVEDLVEQWRALRAATEAEAAAAAAALAQQAEAEPVGDPRPRRWRWRRRARP